MMHTTKLIGPHQRLIGGYILSIMAWLQWPYLNCPCAPIITRSVRHKAWRKPTRKRAHESLNFYTTMANADDASTAPRASQTERSRRLLTYIKLALDITRDDTADADIENHFGSHSTPFSGQLDFPRLMTFNSTTTFNATPRVRSFTNASIQFCKEKPE